ncbi:MAG: molybdopterin adenylyltransferase [Opitutales bacterium]|nr:molybdopterin adenylyltransferase [Opitutales bacterium]MCH8540504.1 molybdopterin adenylyltransferase [Opitutales bacterium]
MQIRIGILNISDRASKNEYPDEPGQRIKSVLQEWLKGPWDLAYKVIPDDRDLIARELCQMADEQKCCLILTTGGTGPAVRDVTPEATEQVCEKMLPGFGEQMRSVSLAYVPTAILSRQTAGIRGQCLIVNLPGRPKAGKECLEAVFPAIPYCIDLLEGPRLETYPEKISVFRPGQS